MNKLKLTWPMLYGSMCGLIIGYLLGRGEVSASASFIGFITAMFFVLGMAFCCLLDDESANEQKGFNK